MDVWNGARAYHLIICVASSKVHEFVRRGIYIAVRCICVTVRICKTCYHLQLIYTNGSLLQCIQECIGGKRSPAILNYLYLPSITTTGLHSWCILGNIWCINSAVLWKFHSITNVNDTESSLRIALFLSCFLVLWQLKGGVGGAEEPNNIWGQITFIHFGDRVLLTHNV